MSQTISETGTYYPETYDFPTLANLPVEEEEEEEFDYKSSIFAPQYPAYWAFLSTEIDWDNQPF